MKVKQILARVYVNDSDEGLKFYEALLGKRCESRFKMITIGLEIMRIDNMLIIAGGEKALADFKTTTATFLVDSVEEYREFLLQNGGVIIRDIQQVPTGKNITMQHQDGTIIEYVEHGHK